MEKRFVKEERVDTYYKFWPIVKWHKDSEGNVFGICFPFFLFVLQP